MLNILAKAGVILVPILLIYLYYHYGREKMFTVPGIYEHYSESVS